MINAKQLKNLIVIPVLKDIGRYSASAVNLLMGTAMQESKLGTYLKQLGSGPAVGLFQLEPATIYDTMRRYGKYNDQFTKATGIDVALISDKALVDFAMTDLKVATAICRIKYLMVPEALPDKNDVKGLAAYWKQYYNTPKGAGSVNQFIVNYKKLQGLL